MVALNFAISTSSLKLAPEHLILYTMEAERCTFFGPLPLVYILTFADRRRLSPKVADSRRSSPTVAARRRLSPIRDRKIRTMKKKFANALWPTCAKCACERLTFELSLDNDIIQPQDGPLDGKQCDIVLVNILCYRASTLLYI